MYFSNYSSNSRNVRFYFAKKHTLIEIIRKDKTDLLYPCKIDSPQYLAWPLISNLFLYSSNEFPFFENCFLSFHPLLLKFRHCEKATKFLPILYSVVSKQLGDFFIIFVAFSENLNFARRLNNIQRNWNRYFHSYSKDSLISGTFSFWSFSQNIVPNH